jgi:hypothetical protein
MAARKSPPEYRQAPAQEPLSEPVPYTAHQDHSFTLQAIMELQKSSGKVEAALLANTSAIEKLDAKIDRVEEKLSGVTHKIYAASVVVALLIAVGAFVVNKAWDVAAGHLVDIAKTVITAPK